RQGNVTSFTNATGATWRYAYDPFGIPVEIVAPSGLATTLFYDDGHNLVGLERSDGKKTAYELDAMKRIVVTRHPAGGEARYRYVADALVEVVHPDGTRWRMAYDPLLRLRAVTNAAGETATREYDGKGNLRTETTFSGIKRTYEHDACDRVRRVTRGDGTTTT